MTTCEVCGRTINTRTDAYYQRMEGWAKVRRGGGPNALSNPIRHDLYRCATCVESRVHPDQLLMFD